MQNYIFHVDFKRAGSSIPPLKIDKCILSCYQLGSADLGVRLFQCDFAHRRIQPGLEEGVESRYKIDRDEIRVGAGSPMVSLRETR